MLMFQIVMAALLLLCTAIIYAIMMDLGNAKGTVVLGSSLPPTLAYTEAVTPITKRYKKRVKRALLLLLLAYLPVFFIPYMSLSITYMMLWLCVSIVLPMYYFAMGNREIRQLKAADSSGRDEEDGFWADAGMTAPPTHTLHPLSFLPPVLLALSPIIGEILHYDSLESPVWILFYGTLGFCCLILGLCAYGVDRMKTQILCRNSEVNLSYSIAKRKLWNQVFLILAWLTALFALVFWLLNGQDKPASMLIPGILYGLLTVGIVFWYWKKNQKLMAFFREKAAAYPLPVTNDDKYWWNGILYYNPHDPHMMTESRTGMGTTCNLATPVGKALAIFVILCLLSLPLMCVWVIADEFVPMRLYLEDDTVVARQWKEDYTIPLEEITELQLIHDLDIQNKVNGSAIGPKNKGLFRTKEYGRCRLFLTESHDNYLVLTTKEELYIFNDETKAATLALYDAIQEKLHE